MAVGTFSETGANPEKMVVWPVILGLVGNPNIHTIVFWMVAPIQNIIVCSSGIYECDHIFLGKKDLCRCNEANDLEMRGFGLSKWALNTMTCVFIRKRQKETWDTQGRRWCEDGNKRFEWHSNKPTKPGVTKSSKKHKRILLQSPWKECGLADTLILHSGL